MDRPFRYTLGQHSDSDTFAQRFNLRAQCRHDNHHLSIVFGHRLRLQFARSVAYDNTSVSCDRLASQRLEDACEWMVRCNDEHVSERADWSSYDVGGMRRLTKCTHGQIGPSGNQRIPDSPKHLGGKA
ncbi:hypothetical protein PTKU64_73820 [Paraburkholderia terrae]|uniref:Uncharacterized protein n=1 Tax=Paraburkholderia terrae TaxID=311230 RepID=A0ABN6JRW3_9BURK|nr:hypothetical protein PTKU64_73820 [Paraburkholderia terrae]